MLKNESPECSEYLLQRRYQRLGLKDLKCPEAAHTYDLWLWWWISLPGCQIVS